MAPTIFMAQYALYVTSHPRFMISQHSIHYISLLYLISNWLYLTAHPQYLCHHTHIIEHIIPILCMITWAQNMWHHIHSLRYQIMLWHSHPLYSCHHTQDTCHHIQGSWAITYSLLTIAHLQYVWYQTHYIYDIIWILCDITTTLCDITRLYSWHHIHTIRDITPNVYGITYTLLVTSQPL